MLLGVVRRGAACLVVEHQVDASLSPQRHVLGAMHRDLAEAQAFEYRLDDVFVGCGELDELESVQPHRVVKNLAHHTTPQEEHGNARSKERS
jgi:hypothetical protein